LGVLQQLDLHIIELLGAFGAWTYLILFALAFGETIWVLTPFLPGYSMLFAAGAIAGRPDAPLHPLILFIGFVISGSLGDSVNYAIGRGIGRRMLDSIRSAKMRQKVARTEEFFDLHSGKTVLMARFVPVARTMAPIVAGVRRMPFRRFLTFNVAGGMLCVGLYLFGGYFFGSVPVVQANFALVLISIVVVSLLPALIEILRFRRKPSSP
jgi:membrane-associated protein